MFVKKSRWVDVGKYGYDVEDVIAFKLTDGEEMQAMAVKQENDGMLFCMVDCLADEYSMNNVNTNEGGYENSDLRKKLNTEVIARFPAWIEAMMVTLDNGDLLRLPTEKEIFGKNGYGECESPYVQQWKPMKQRRNRIASQGKNGDWELYWLQNKRRNSAALFVRVDSDGSADYYHASASIGVRPVFKLKPDRKAW